MSKPEPTEEQREAIKKLLVDIALPAGKTYNGAAENLWRLIAPMVLEAAAKECEQERERWEQIAAHEAVNACTSCALFIRLLKGE